MPPTPSCLGDRDSYLNFFYPQEAVVSVSPGPPLASEPGSVSTHEAKPLEIHSQFQIVPASSFSFEAGGNFRVSQREGMPPLSHSEYIDCWAGNMESGQLAGSSRCPPPRNSEVRQVSARCTEPEVPEAARALPLGLLENSGHLLVSHTWSSSHPPLGVSV